MPLDRFGRRESVSWWTTATATSTTHSPNPIACEWQLWQALETSMIDGWTTRINGGQTGCITVSGYTLLHTCGQPWARLAHPPSSRRWQCMTASVNTFADHHRRRRRGVPSTITLTIVKLQQKQLCYAHTDRLKLIQYEARICSGSVARTLQRWCGLHSERRCLITSTATMVKGKWNETAASERTNTAMSKQCDGCAFHHPQ